MSNHRDPVTRGEAEYDALREEVLKRIELQYQLLNLALIIAGTLLTISLSGGALADDATSDRQRLLLLVCPPVEMFLALAWAAHNVQLAKAGVYIRTVFEARRPGWETYWPEHKGLSRGRKWAVRWCFTGGLPASGVFGLTQVPTLVLSVPTRGARWVWFGWYGLDVLMFFATFACIRASDIRRRIKGPALEAKGEAGREAG